jgi:DNA invertase Pin-like site-specific DNA recombinase
MAPASVGRATHQPERRPRLTRRAPLRAGLVVVDLAAFPRSHPDRTGRRRDCRRVLRHRAVPVIALETAPEALRLLDTIKSTGRDFDTVALYGGMSKGERNRIKVRVRSAMKAQTELEGRYLGGRPPYGYRLADAGPHPNPGKAAEGKRLHRLEPDPVTAPVVQRIFTEYVSGRGMTSIARGLTQDVIPCPSAYDRAPNPHRHTRSGRRQRSARSCTTRTTPAVRSGTRTHR